MDSSSTTPNPAPVDRKALEARATELGVSFQPNIGDKKLGQRVAAAEAKVAAAEKLAAEQKAEATAAASTATPDPTVEQPAPSGTDETNDTSTTPNPAAGDGTQVVGADGAPLVDENASTVELLLTTDQVADLAQPVALELVLDEPNCPCGEPGTWAYSLALGRGLAPGELTDDAFAYCAVHGPNTPPVESTDPEGKHDDDALVVLVDDAPVSYVDRVEFGPRYLTIHAVADAPVSEVSKLMKAQSVTVNGKRIERFSSRTIAPTEPFRVTLTTFHTISA